ncbi:Endo-1,4-beta-xylanase Z [Dyadobacter sp. CECT 9623]|uniref:Endo-1,4-beta-xylanase Z n=1 Tax=Dyadobacter linearis TaxID=2823330 RepID=A0ABM8UMS8_9BACT|nr:alpha/beta hydrolase-fold protein [Dyadobacter sp. CECT 9623]CAG5068765.1 Endo-1,4-beta-xylanase Z [Dyadobacter sp. CECT 9623]
MKVSGLFFLLIVITNSLTAQTSKVYDQLTLPSKLLKSDRKFAIYLPPDYATSERSYPVLYLLHGAGDDQTGWVQFGMVQHIADKAIADGTAAPMIIVMPDANTGRRGYFNDVKGDWPYEDFFFKELIPFIEKKYRVKTEKEFRAVAGLSMGGGGTFMYALHHPELFAAACPLSASTGPITLEDAKKNLVRNNPNIADSTVARYYERHSALALINNIPDDQKKAVKWYIDCGDDDFLYEGNALVHIALRKKEVPHEFRVREGAHNWKYWRESLPAVLDFVSQSFHR